MTLEERADIIEQTFTHPTIRALVLLHLKQVEHEAFVEGMNVILKAAQEALGRQKEAR